MEGIDKFEGEASTLENQEMEPTEEDRQELTKILEKFKENRIVKGLAKDLFGSPFDPDALSQVFLRLLKGRE